MHIIYIYMFPSFPTDLCGADVAGGLVTTDVLFSGLQRQPVRRSSLHVPRHPHHTSRDRAQEVLPAGEEAGMGSPIAQGYAEALVGADGDVHANVAGRSKDGHGQKICGTHHQCLLDGRHKQIRLWFFVPERDNKGII